MRKSPSALALPGPYGPWPRPVVQTASRWPFPATAWCAATAIFPATAGAWSASANCSSAKPAANKARRAVSPHNEELEQRQPPFFSPEPRGTGGVLAYHPPSSCAGHENGPQSYLRAVISVRTQCLLVGCQRRFWLVGRHSGLDQFLANLVF